MKTETVPLALFDIGTGIHTVTGKHMENYDGYTRISDYQDVTFNLLPEETVIKNHIQVIDKKIETTMDEANRKIERLKQRKAELMALKHEDLK